MVSADPKIEAAVSSQLNLYVHNILALLGYDPTNNHFRRTPERVADLLAEFACNADPSEVARLLDVKYEEDYTELVMVGPVRYDSMCAHHMLPVTGSAWVGYLPNEGRVCGLSKLSRLVEYYARQFTVQERVTDQVADALEEHLKPKGCMVVVRASHGCMTMRGVREPAAITTTSAVRGVHKDSASARTEFLSLMHQINH
jgi:GTP cyclohydrolase IA